MTSEESTEDRTPFDLAFDDALTHLAGCRMAYDDDPRDPERVTALAAARDRLEEARKAMNAERDRLGLSPRKLPESAVRKIEGEPMHLWQAIQQEG
ncbi:MAG: hypothetical protein GY708_01325 [Actinomycetia bacterium]|nr:hypothetical protein [Actinomycetes bacterium]MCP4960564.1 hypothetical protein [Actinomycetes bacterium]